jgi:VCBS repeat-containing protein
MGYNVTLPINHTPAVIQNTLASATALSGTYVYDLSNIDRASLQLNATWDTTDTTTVTLNLSNDGVNFVGFAVAKTLSVSGTTNGMFELGAIDYRYLQVAWTTPGSSHHLTLVGTLCSKPTIVMDA